jgi:hypothetical protein
MAPPARKISRRVSREASPDFLLFFMLILPQTAIGRSSNSQIGSAIIAESGARYAHVFGAKARISEEGNKHANDPTCNDRGGRSWSYYLVRRIRRERLRQRLALGLARPSLRPQLMMLSLQPQPDGGGCDRAMRSGRPCGRPFGSGA